MTETGIPRRCLFDLGLAAAGTLAWPRASRAAWGSVDGPRLGDVFVAVANRTVVLGPKTIEADAPPLLAWPMEPKTGLVRSESRFNQVLVLRLQNAGGGAPDGILVFSAICQHAGCAVSGWIADRRILLCPCHGSEYDPAHNGAVVAGPAPAPLPRLPVEIAADRIVVSGPFSGRVGGHTGRTD